MTSVNDFVKHTHEIEGVGYKWWPLLHYEGGGQRGGGPGPMWAGRGGGEGRRRRKHSHENF